jgi:methyl-accepting chemotaxis protein
MMAHRHGSVLVLALLLAACGHQSELADARAEAKAVAELATEIIASAHADAVEVAEIVSAARAAGEPREGLAKLVEPVVLSHADYVGVAIAFEPDAYDGKDSEYRHLTPDGDADGRFAPYLFRSADNKVLVEPLIMDEAAGIDSWYLPPLRSKETYLAEPFLYPVNGIDQLMISLCVPILDDDDAIGVVTVDPNLARFTKSVMDRDKNWAGEIWLVSQEGYWIVHRDPDRIGQKVEPRASSDAVESAVIAAAVANSEPEANTASRDTGWPLVVERIAFKGMLQSWTVIVSSPE